MCGGALVREDQSERSKESNTHIQPGISLFQPDGAENLQYTRHSEGSSTIGIPSLGIVSPEWNDDLVLTDVERKT